MDGTGRDEAPFSGRVWQEIDRTIASIRAANCTARRFLEIDGPYGLGLTSTARDEGWLPPVTVGAPPVELGATPRAWNVLRAAAQAPDSEPTQVHGGTFLVDGDARRVPLIASEFRLGIRAVEAYEAGCQPLDLSRAIRAARDLALEEERGIYYGFGSDPMRLLWPSPSGAPVNVTAITQALGLIGSIHVAITRLARRGYAGPFALVAGPGLYARIYAPTRLQNALRVDLLRNLFRGGIYLAPVINPLGDPRRRRGAIITVGRGYSRLVVGQDWVTSYRGRDGVLYRFLLMSSLQLQVSDPRSIQVLT